MISAVCLWYLRFGGSKSPILENCLTGHQDFSVKSRFSRSLPLRSAISWKILDFNCLPLGSAILRLRKPDFRDFLDWASGSFIRIPSLGAPGAPSRPSETLFSLRGTPISKNFPPSGEPGGRTLQQGGASLRDHPYAYLLVNKKTRSTACLGPRRPIGRSSRKPPTHHSPDRPCTTLPPNRTRQRQKKTTPDKKIAEFAPKGPQKPQKYTNTDQRWLDVATETFFGPRILLHRP